MVTPNASPSILTANLGAGMTEIARGVRPWICSCSSAERARSGIPAVKASGMDIQTLLYTSLPPSLQTYRPSPTSPKVPYTFPNTSSTSYLNIFSDSHLEEFQSSTPPSPAMVQKPTHDNQNQQWSGLPTCYGADFSEDLRPPVTDGTKTTRQHKELGQNFQLLLRTPEMQIAQEESCLAVEEWGGREEDSATVIGRMVVRWE